MARAAGWLLVAVLAGPAPAAEPPIVAGAALPLSGLYADLAAGRRNAYELWRDEVNAAGGLLGRSVELRLLDDGSDAVRARGLYRQLIEQERAELLLAPFGTAATLLAAATADRSRRVLVHASGAARSLHRKPPRYVFQAVAPYSAWADGVLQLAKDAGQRRLLLLARADPVAREMAQAAREQALKLGLAPGEIESYAASTEDFAPQVAKARAAGVEAWIAFGQARDAAEMVKTFKRLGYAPRLFFAQGAAAPEFIERVGQDAESSLGALSWLAGLATPGNASFVQRYRRRFGVAPDAGAAAGYATLQVLGTAVRRAGTLEQEKLRDTLAALEVGTVLGNFRADASTGEQRALEPLVVQIVKGRREVVWPAPLASARARLPFPRWEERVILQPSSQWKGLPQWH